MVKEYGKCRVNAQNKTITSSINISEINTIKPQIAPPKLTVRDSDEVQRFRVQISNIKSLAKINGFSSNDTINFYIEPNLPMKLRVGIGTFGKLNVLIRTL